MQRGQRLGRVAGGLYPWCKASPDPLGRPDEAGAGGGQAPWAGVWARVRLLHSVGLRATPQLCFHPRLSWPHEGEPRHLGDPHGMTAKRGGPAPRHLRAGPRESWQDKGTWSERGELKMLPPLCSLRPRLCSCS